MIFRRRCGNRRDAGGADRPRRQGAGLVRKRARGNPFGTYRVGGAGPDDWWRAAREAIAGAMAASKLTGAEIEAVD